MKFSAQHKEATQENTSIKRHILALYSKPMNQTLAAQKYAIFREAH